MKFRTEGEGWRIDRVRVEFEAETEAEAETDAETDAEAETENLSG